MGKTQDTSGNSAEPPAEGSLADIVHPRLATLYELFCEDDRWFFTMKLIEGSDFLGYLRAPARERIGFDSTVADVPKIGTPTPP